MKSGRIGAHQNMYFYSSMIMEQRARSLRLKLCKLFFFLIATTHIHTITLKYELTLH